MFLLWFVNVSEENFSKGKISSEVIAAESTIQILSSMVIKFKMDTSKKSYDTCLKKTVTLISTVIFLKILLLLLAKISRNKKYFLNRYSLCLAILNTENLQHNKKSYSI
jgi:heme/copper-type cytochrome/quinol oxidase subunit 4